MEFLLGILFLILLVVGKTIVYCRERYRFEGPRFIGKMVILIILLSIPAAGPVYNYWRKGQVEELHIAFRLNQVDKVKEMISSGVSVHHRGKGGDLAIHAAVSSGNMELLKLVLEKEVNLEEWSKSKYTPLCMTAQRGFIEMMKVLLDHGAQVDSRSSFNNTPLMIAIRKGRLDMVELLLSRGADVTARDNNTRDPFFHAVVHLRPKILQLLLDKKKHRLDQDSLGFNLLHDVNMYGTMFRKKEINALEQLEETVKILDKAGISWTEFDKKGRTPSHIAFEYQKGEILDTLIKAGANLEAKNHDGDTPLHVAIRKRHWTGVRRLYDLGADVRAKTHEGLMAFELAQKYTLNAETIELLRPEGHVEKEDETEADKEGSALGGH